MLKTNNGSCKVEATECLCRLVELRSIRKI